MCHTSLSDWSRYTLTSSMTQNQRDISFTTFCQVPFMTQRNFIAVGARLPTRLQEVERVEERLPKCTLHGSHSYSNTASEKRH